MFGRVPLPPVRIENSFVPVKGVGERTEQQLWEQGITHWDEFERDALGPTTGRRVAEFIDEGRDRLADGDARFFAGAFPSKHVWRLYENFREETAFFDIETTGLSKDRHQVTTVTVHRGGETRTLVAERDPFVGEPLSEAALRETVGDAPLMVTFNGKRFDVPFLEANLDCTLDAPHVDLMYPCRQLGLTGGLKTIEREVGIDRGADIDGREAVRLWHAYRSGNDRALERLVEYNRDDTVNLRTLMEVVANRLHDERVPRSR
jgi:hypothetical protein